MESNYSKHNSSKAAHYDKYYKVNKCLWIATSMCA